MLLFKLGSFRFYMNIYWSHGHHDVINDTIFVLGTCFANYTLFLYATLGWNWQKIKQILSNNPSLNFCYLKIIHILHPRYHPHITLSPVSCGFGHIHWRNPWWNTLFSVQCKQKKKCVCIHEIMRLIIIKMKMSMDTNIVKYKKCLSMMMLICIK